MRCHLRLVWWFPQCAVDDDGGGAAGADRIDYSGDTDTPGDTPARGARQYFPWGTDDPGASDDPRASDDPGASNAADDHWDAVD